MDQFSDIAQTYDWTEHSTDDIQFFVDLASQEEGPILELGAGTGRITIPVAELGKPVFALDISKSMLSRAMAKARSHSNIHFKTGDFRSFSLCQRFRLILAPGRVFEHAMSGPERRSAFAGCAYHLKPEGILALHVWGPPADTNPTPPEKTKSLDATDQHGTLLFSWREERNFEAETRKHYFKIKETDGQKREWAHDPIEVCWYTANVLDKLGHVAGLTVFGRFRDFHGGPYQPGSLNMIWVYRKE
jgi:SAM-dependent methyltransferase